MNCVLLEKYFNMTTSDLKLKIFRQIDSLGKEELEEFYGILLNYINGQTDVKDWDAMTEGQKNGIYKAIQEIEDGAGIPNHVVLEKLQAKYRND